MTRILLFLLVCGVSYAEQSISPRTSTIPFEPESSQFLNPADKFAHPPEIVSPHFLFPFEFRRGGGAVVPAEVIVLVKLDGSGRAEQLKVLACDREPFARSALEALTRARWQTTSSRWFYYRHIYTLND